tara:strand:- start:676 stop:1479 length:804 start_codon:yes stop_codon:yes gene_type:complete
MSSFYLDDDLRWKFESPEELNAMPVGIDRWGGVTLLLSGPKVHRTLVDIEPTDINQYGLSENPYIVDIGLTKERSIKVILGDKTPDNNNQYARIDGYPQVFTIYGGWGDIFSRLVTDLPYPYWYYNVDPININYIKLTSDGKDVYLSISPEGWVTSASDDTPLQGPIVKELRNALNPPKKQGIVEYSSRELAAYGLDQPHMTLFLNTNDLTPESVTVKSELIIHIGDLLEDNNYYYGLTENPGGDPDVFFISSDWVDKLKELTEKID